MRTPREVAESYWSAECQRDIVAIMAHYLPDATYQDGAGHLEGQDAIRGYYEASIRDFPALEVTIQREFIASPDSSALEVHAVLTDHEGKRSVIEGLIAITVRDGRLHHIRCYEDPLRPESDGGVEAR
ncbi:MAG: nuclear transport factor 2 family protein [Chloroflexota bacterium]